MPDLAGHKVILAVSQLPFETPSPDGGVLNQFATLAPLVLEDGAPADPQDFPNNGLVWWMVRTGHQSLAQPGRLLSAVLEHGQPGRYDPNDPDRTFYQVDRDSVESVKPDDLLEILTVTHSDLHSPRDLVRPRPFLILDHPPSPQVLVRWGDHLYGPLRASFEIRQPDRNEYAVTLSKRSPTQEIVKIPAERLTSLRRGYLSRVTASVSLDKQSRARSRKPFTCTYDLLLASGLEELEAGPIERLRLETDEEVLVRVARDLLAPRAKRQQFGALLRELGDRVSTTLGDASDVAGIIRSILTTIEDSDTQARHLVEEILNSGLLDTRVEDGIQNRFNRYVQEHSARAQAEIAALVALTRSQLDALQRDRDALEHELDTIRRRSAAELERELSGTRQRFEGEVREERERLDRQLQDLTEQRQLHAKHLEDVLKRFTTARDEVVNQYLSLEPLFAATHLVRGTPSAPLPPSTPERPHQSQVRTFELPAFVKADPYPISNLSEVQFFERLRGHVKSSGFTYRDIDLIRLHLSVKCCDITVLGGVSGTGKSSLTRLYAEALAGSDTDASQRFLTIAVNPAWLDIQDLVGHVNTLEATFQPSESGLYRQLIIAHEEHLHRGSDSPLYTVCLDEMNLAHVEHYFSGFLQALEQPSEARVVRCFDPETIDASSPFARWAALLLPRSLRFIGTVNLDETTKPLSIRLLDRINFIALAPTALPGVSIDPRDDARSAVTGPPITTRMFRSWIHNAELPAELASVIDDIGQHLRILGCPVNPRRYRAICQFVASARDLCSPLQALDLQIAQRLAPQIRGIFRREGQAALDAILRILENHPHKFPESTIVLRQTKDTEFDSYTTVQGE